MTPDELPQPKIQPLPDGLHWRVLDDFTLTLSEETVTVPAGFVTDGASVPRFGWVAIPPVGRYFPAALVHDWLYHRHRDLGDASRTREGVDFFFHRIMEAYGVDLGLRDIMLDAVRVAGGPAWEGVAHVPPVVAPDPPSNR